MSRLNGKLLRNCMRQRSFCTAENVDGNLQISKVQIFDRHLKRKQVELNFSSPFLVIPVSCLPTGKRDRAAWLISQKDYLVNTVADNCLIAWRLQAIFGGETLKELRIACTIAHMEREGGVSPRISPLAQVIYMTGWREHESQQKAKWRGSATVSFKDI
ncbi:hypothetical protein L1887_04016 [Cichorium endivia]|nr:hypothetical protein L1887_04016 [Cichorium endivia]